jgi:hypothetical protein
MAGNIRLLNRVLQCHGRSEVEVKLTWSSTQLQPGKVIFFLLDSFTELEQ